jgi:hypothetical protein
VVSIDPDALRLESASFVVVVVPMSLSIRERLEFASRLRPASAADSAEADPFNDVRSELVVIQDDLYGFDFGFRRRELNTLSYCSALRIGCPSVTHMYHSGRASATALRCARQSRNARSSRSHSLWLR